MVQGLSFKSYCSHLFRGLCVHRYENEDQIVRFTEAQLAEIRKMTLSKILCENMDIQSDMQRSAFDQPSNFL
jgi:HrpA-like RNA helicase